MELVPVNKPNKKKGFMGRLMEAAEQKQREQTKQRRRR
jgi:hypothetical protein